MEIIGWIMLAILACVVIGVVVKYIGWDGLFITVLALVLAGVFCGLIILAIGMIQHGDVVTIWTQ